MAGTIYESFGRRLRLIRTHQGYTQEALAKKIGIHPNYISDVENGRRNITLKVIAKIAQGLNISVKDFF